MSSDKGRGCVPPGCMHIETVSNDPEEELKNGIWPRSVLLWVVVFYMAIFIIRPWEILFPYLADIHFERLYALFMIVCLILSKKEASTILNSQIILVLLFLGTLTISTLFAWNPDLGSETLYMYTTLVIFSLIFISAIRTPYELLFILICYLVVMGSYLAKSQWEYFIHGAGKYDMYVHRMWGIEWTYGYPNAVAQSIVLSLPFFVLIWSVRTNLSCQWPTFWRKMFTPFLIIYLLLATSSILLTNSRIGMVSFILFSIMVGLRGKGITKLKYVSLAILFLCILWQVIPEEKKGRFQTIWDSESGPGADAAQASATGRIEGFMAGIEMFKESPIIGVGIGNFKAYRVKHLDGVNLNAHNLFGQALGETGLLGTSAFFLMVIVALTNCRKVRTMRNACSTVKAKVLSGVALACRDTILLALFMGLTSHNLLRYNWLWVIVFSVKSYYLMNQCCDE